MAWHENGEEIEESSGFAVVISRAHIAPTTASHMEEGGAWLEAGDGWPHDGCPRSLPSFGSSIDKSWYRYGGQGKQAMATWSDRLPSTFSLPGPQHRCSHAVASSR